MGAPASIDRLAGSALAERDVAPAFRDECGQFFGDLAQVFGFGRSVGQIYGLLFASPQPLTFTDIAESLDISRGSTSQGLSFLRELGAVRVVEARGTRAEMGDGRWQMGTNRSESEPEPLAKSQPALGVAQEASTKSQPQNSISHLPSPNSARGGNRRELYLPELQLRKLVAGVLRERVDPVVKGGAVRIKQLREHAKASPTPAGEKFSQERLKKLENWRRQMGLLLPILKTILGPTRG